MIAEVWEANFKIKEIYESIIAGQKKFLTKEFAPGYLGRSILPEEGSVYHHWESENILLTSKGELNLERLDQSKNDSTISFTTPELIEVYNIVASKGLNPVWMRLGILKPGGMLPWHLDGVPDKHYVRLHIPLMTNPQCFFETETEKEHLEANGNAYFIRVNTTHRVYNHGLTERWHLIMDVTDSVGMTKFHSSPKEQN